MRNSLFMVSFGLSLLPFLATNATAETIRKFQASVASVRAACSAAGGTFGVHMDGGGYGCDAKNGQVHCDNKNNCVGVTPRNLGAMPGTLLGILGVSGVGSSGSSGEATQSAISGNSTPVVEDKPIRDLATPPDTNVTGNGGLTGGGIGQ